MTATTQATLPRYDRGADDDGYSTRIVLSAVPHRTGETATPALRSELANYFSKLYGDGGRDYADQVLDKDSPAVFPADHVDREVYCYGTDNSIFTDMSRIVDAAGSINRVVVTSLSSLGPDHAAIVWSLDQIEELLPAGTTITIASCAQVCTGSDEFDILRRTCKASADAAVKRQREPRKTDVRRWCDIDKNKEGGRSSLGFEWVDGDLVPDSSYTEVCATLEMVQDGEISKSKAATHLNTSPRTITRCIEERSRRYGLHI